MILERSKDRLYSILCSIGSQKRMKHRSDVGSSSCSENESRSIVLYFLEFRKKILRIGCDCIGKCSYHLHSKLRSWFQKPFCPYNKSVWH